MHCNSWASSEEREAGPHSGPGMGDKVRVLTLKIQGWPPKVNRNGFPRLG